MAIVNRKIELYDAFDSEVFFMNGDKPFPKLLIDEEEGMVYIPFVIDFHGEKIYEKITIEDYMKRIGI